MAVKFLVLLVCCLAISQVLSASTVKPAPPQRRPNEYLQPPPPPSSPPSTLRRQIPNSRQRSFRVSHSPSRTTASVPASTSNHIPLSVPIAGVGKQIPSGSTTLLNKVPSPASQRNPGAAFGSSGNKSLQKPRDASPKTNSSSTVGNGSNITVGPPGQRSHRSSSGSTQEKQRVARWFFSHPVADSEAQPTRTNKAILRPPPALTNYNQVSLQPPPPPHHALQQSSSATLVHPQFHPPPPPFHRNQYHKTKDCNPCNKIPWIPIPRGIPQVHHDDTAVGHSHGPSNAYLPPAPQLNGQYELPSVATLPLQSSSAAEHYGPPLPPLSPPGDQYGAPQSFSASQSKPDGQYGPPPPPPPSPPIKLLDDQFRPPPPAQTPISQYGTPSVEFGSSQQHATGDDYGPPPPPPPPSYRDSAHEQTSPQLAPSYLPAAPVYEPESFNDSPSSGRGNNNFVHNGDNREATSYHKQNFGSEHSSLSHEQTHLHEQGPQQLEPLPDLQQSHINPSSHSVSYSGTSESQDNHPGQYNDNDQEGDEIVDIVKSVPIIEDSYSVTAQHPTSTAIHSVQSSEQAKTETSLSNKQQTSFTSGGNNGISVQQQENLQYYAQNQQQKHQQQQQLHHQQNNLLNHYHQTLDHIRNGNQQGNLEVIPSIPVIDYLSSIEYPLQIIQSPFIDVTEPPNRPVIRGTQEGTITGFDKHTVSTSYSTSSGSWSSSKGPNSNSSKTNGNREGEIIVGKPALKVSTLNVSSSEARDQKQSATNLKNHNLETRPIVIDYPTSNADLSEDSSSSLEDHKAKPSHFNLDSIGGTNLKQEFTSSAKDTFNIQPSLQTVSEGGNALIHEINSVFKTQETSSDALPSFSQSSNYVLFQNFPQPPIGYLPPDVLKQKLPPPTPFQSTIKQKPLIITTPHTPTSTFGHALKLEAPITFLNPPPRNSHESYTTVSNTPAPSINTFWTQSPNSFLSTPISSNSEATTLSWGTSTTAAPFKISNPNLINAFAEAAGLLPPPQVSLNQPSSNKKTKQIQIIVPYTSSKDLMQFHNFPDSKSPTFDSTGWQPMLTTTVESSPVVQQARKVPPNDSHENQESKIVTTKTPVAEATYNELQHIFASNIRDLLRGEQENGNIRTTPDILKLQNLQKNIDEWTALEYSKRRNVARQNKIRNNTATFEAQKATTSSATSFHHLLVPSKKIPDEYLTTTPSIFDDVQTTENNIATPFPRFRKNGNYSITTKTTSVPTSTLRPTTTKTVGVPFYDHEASGSQRHSVRTAVKANESENKNGISEDEGRVTFLIDSPLNHQRKGENHKWKIIESNYILPEAVVSQTTTSTTLPPTTTLSWEEATDVYTTTRPSTTWEKLPLSISPFTNEKVYVVTPVTTGRPPSTTSTIAPQQWRGNVRHSTSINDIFPFRNGPPKAERLVAATPVGKEDDSNTGVDSPVTFRSPRFTIRPTPGTSIQRSFTVASDVSGERTSRQTGAKSLKLEPVSLNEIRFTGPKNKTILGTTTTKRPLLDVLLGLTDLPTYTPPNGTKVETLTGHSKVVTVATHPTVPTPIFRRTQESRKRKPATSITKLYPVSTSTAAPATAATGLSHPKPRGGITSRSAKSSRDLSSSWQFPDLSKEENESIEAAEIELKKEKSL